MDGDDEDMRKTDEVLKILLQQKPEQHKDMSKVENPKAKAQRVRREKEKSAET